MAKPVRNVRATWADEAGRLWASIPGLVSSPFRRLWTAYVVAEHHCHPPMDGRDWVAMPSDTPAADGYICPECEQHFAPRKAG
jgi:hypothetical protein